MYTGTQAHKDNRNSRLLQTGCSSRPEADAQPDPVSRTRHRRAGSRQQLASLRRLAETSAVHSAAERGLVREAESECCASRVAQERGGREEVCGGDCLDAYESGRI